MLDFKPALKWRISNFKIRYWFYWWPFYRLDASPMVGYLFDFFNRICLGSTAESIIDSIFESLPKYLVKISDESRIQSVDRIIRSCPFKFVETLVDGEISYFTSICANITNLVPVVSMSFTLLSILNNYLSLLSLHYYFYQGDIFCSVEQQTLS